MQRSGLKNQTHKSKHNQNFENEKKNKKKIPPQESECYSLHPTLNILNIMEQDTP